MHQGYGILASISLSPEALSSEEVQSLFPYLESTPSTQVGCWIATFSSASPSSRPSLAPISIFSAYLGVLANPEHPVLGALTGWIAIFTPGLILKFALLPFYVKLREKRVARSLLRGLNAAAVGLIFVAVVQLWKAGARTVKGPTTLESDTWWLIVGSMSFVSVQWYNNPPPVAIVMGGIAGLAWYVVHM